MFRFHDLKTGQDPDMVVGGSRSSTPSEPVDGRALFPSVIRSELNAPGNQLRVNPQYPIAASPGAGYVGQGAPLMSLGHNIMFPPGKLLATPSQEAHRYMTEAYRLAAGELESSNVSYGVPSGRLPGESQPSLTDAHKSPPDGVPLGAGNRPHGISHRPHGVIDSHHPSDRDIYNPINLAPQINSEPSRAESDVPRGLAELPYNISRSPSNKAEGEALSYEKSAYSGGVASGVSQPSSASPKAKGPPISIGGPHLFQGPFTSSYEQYCDGIPGNFKRPYYDDSSGHRRDGLSLPDSNVGDSSQAMRGEGSPPSGDQVQENIGFNSGCPDVDLYSRESQSRTGSEADHGSHLNLDLLTRATSSQAGSLDRPKLMKGRQLKAYKCDICELEFKNGTQLKNHAWRHTGEKPFSCDLCQATFTQQSNLKTHLRIHTGERPYTCEECNATFTQISNLRTHQKIHTGEKPYECDICFTRFSQQSNLKSHKLIHTGERPFSCEECGATFVQSTHLRNHKRIHTDERPYTCDQCGGSFRQLSNLKTHEKIHTGERPHVCEECGSAFAQKSNLKSHMLKLHSNDGAPIRRGRKKKLEAIVPFICEECGAKFTLMSNLKIHMRLHTGEKPFVCSVCGASFAQRSNLKAHEQIHSDDRPYKCLECPAAFRQKTNLKTHKMKKHPVKSLKIKILSDTQYIMHDIMHDIIQSEDNEGEGTSQHIEEPIVQIREGKDDHLLLGGGDGIKSESGERYEDHNEGLAETERYNDHGDALTESSAFRQDAMGVAAINPYDSPNF